MSAKTDPARADTLPGPWQGNELKRFWAMLKTAGITKETVTELVMTTCGADSLHGLTRPQWVSLLDKVSTWSRQARSANDPHHGRATAAQWARIRWLQRQLGWTDEHLDAYIRKHGHIDAVRFMTAAIGRAIITGMEKIKNYVPQSIDKTKETV